MSTAGTITSSCGSEHTDTLFVCLKRQFSCTLVYTNHRTPTSLSSSHVSVTRRGSERVGRKGLPQMGGRRKSTQRGASPTTVEAVRELDCWADWTPATFLPDRSQVGCTRALTSRWCLHYFVLFTVIEHWEVLFHMSYTVVFPFAIKLKLCSA